MRLVVSGVIGLCLLANVHAEERPDDPLACGTLIIIGGGTLPGAVVKLFVKRAGGKDARLVVIPTATTDARIGDGAAYLEKWKQRGVGHVDVLHTRSRETADTAAFVAPLKKATAVWFGGGSQSRIADAYVGTATERELMALLRRGGIVGGTSAGAAIQSRVMIAGGMNPPRIATGFDFLPGAIVDQHFSQRKRKPRLRLALNAHKNLWGFGIDEGTALVVHGNTASVMGQGTVTQIAPKASPASMQETIHRAGAEFSIENIRNAASATKQK